LDKEFCCLRVRRMREFNIALFGSDVGG